MGEKEKYPIMVRLTLGFRTMSIETRAVIEQKIIDLLNNDSTVDEPTTIKGEWSETPPLLKESEK